MVRINLIDPLCLADQHLVAEYNEILMLLGHVRKHPEPTGIPPTYPLGPGHIRFFKDKLRYLKERHELLKVEMRRRGYAPTKTIDLREFPSALCNSWSPTPADEKIILARLRAKLTLKPEYYTYERKHRPLSFFLSLLRRRPQRAAGTRSSPRRRS